MEVEATAELTPRLLATVGPQRRLRLASHLLTYHVVRTSMSYAYHSREFHDCMTAESVQMIEHIS